MIKLPNFLLIGPGRTGTSWVTKNLMLHPDIFMPRCKETRFFNHRYEKGLKWYGAHFNGHREKAIGEASVGYFANAQSAIRIHQHMPEVKMIATFRDPVDRAYSSMGRLRAMAKKGDINLDIDFEEKLRITPRLIEQGKYATHLQHYYSIFPPENILVLFYHDMKQSPREFLERIYTFLDVDPCFDSPLLNQRINATATVSADSKIKKLLYKVLLRLDLFSLSKQVDSTMRKATAPLQPEVRERVLKEYYLEEIAKLESMLNVDLSRWKETPNSLP